MGAYSADLRERILRAIEGGASDQEAAKRYGVHRNTVWKYRKRYEESGERLARQAGGKKPSKLAGHDEALRRWMEQENGPTIAELHAKCREELGIEVVPSTIWYRLKSLGLSHKKKSAGGRTKPPRR